MKKIHLVLMKLKSNHTSVVAAFESSSLADIYRLHKQNERGNEYSKFITKEVAVLDGTPEMNKIMLGFPEGS